jgi:hypothetical protein
MQGGGHYWNVNSVTDVTDLAVQLVFLSIDGHSPGQKVSYLAEAQGLSSSSQMLSPILTQLNQVSHTFSYILDPF